MTIAVTGATGRVGRHVLAALGQTGLAVRALARNPARVVLSSSAMSAQAADMDQPDSMRIALAGADTLVLISADGPRQVAQATAAIDTARAVGVARIVLISAMLAGETPPLSFGINHAAIEAHLRASGLAWTILRPSFFMQTLDMFAEDIRRKDKLIIAVPSGRVAFVDLVDVADAVVACVRADPVNQRVFILTGDQALSFAQVAEALSQATGRAIGHIAPPRWLARILLPLIGGVDSWTTGRLIAMCKALEEGREASLVGDLPLLIGRLPSRLSRYLAREAPLFTSQNSVHTKENPAHV
jgi:NAD(P)H dehydrogenase (quinone)